MYIIYNFIFSLLNMEQENIITNITIKNYIKIFLLKKNIFTKIKINFSTINTGLLNYIIHYYPELHYKINKNYVIISEKNDLNLNSKIKIKLCNSNNILKNNPCKNNIYELESKKNYNIIIGFNQTIKKNNSIVLRTPFNLINITCNSKIKKKELTLHNLGMKIETLLKNNKYIKKYISYVVLE